MKIEINTKEKTIKLLEDVSFEELKELLKTFKNGEDYTIIKTVEVQYQPHYYYPYWGSTSGVIYTTGNNLGTFSVSNNQH